MRKVQATRRGENDEVAWDDIGKEAARNQVSIQPLLSGNTLCLESERFGDRFIEYLQSDVDVLLAQDQRR